MDEIINVPFVPTISWKDLCTNENANVIPIISKHLNDLEYLEWAMLSSNPNAISILEKNIDKFIGQIFLKIKMLFCF